MATGKICIENWWQSCQRIGGDGVSRNLFSGPLISVVGRGENMELLGAKLKKSKKFRGAEICKIKDYHEI